MDLIGGLALMAFGGLLVKAVDVNGIEVFGKKPSPSPAPMPPAPTQNDSERIVVPGNAGFAARLNLDVIDAEEEG